MRRTRAVADRARAELEDVPVEHDQIGELTELRPGLVGTEPCRACAQWIVDLALTVIAIGAAVVAMVKCECSGFRSGVMADTLPSPRSGRAG